MTPDRVADRSVAAGLRAVKAARARVVALARKHPDADPWTLVGWLRAELAKLEPQLARVLSAATLAGWVLAARRPVVDAVPASEVVTERYDLLQSGSQPPAPPSFTGVTPPDDGDDHLITFPLINTAVRDLMSRQAVTRPEYDALTAQAKAAAFTVARVTTNAAVQAVQDAVAETVAQGKTLKRFAREVGPAIDGALSPAQVEAVFRTETSRAAASGTVAALRHDAVSQEFPYVLYDAVRDSRTRPAHRWLAEHGLDGTGVYRIDDPVIRAWWPPCGWNCRCGTALLGVADAAARGVREARQWLATGREPSPPARAPWPPFELPRGWVPPTGAITAAVAW